jgi:uncharacterized membrane protein YphA (DoxX/SURF4 family)
MNKLKYLALSFGLIYVWFGILKFFPNLSPAEDLASQTVDVITFHLIPSNVGYFLLALLEVVIGVGLIIGYKRTIFVKIAIAHMIFTFVPLFVFPELSFTTAPYGFTIVGQYIMKNVVFLVALFLLLPSKEIQKTQG